MLQIPIPQRYRSRKERQRYQRQYGRDATQNGFDEEPGCLCCSLHCVSGEAVPNVHPAEAEAGYCAVYAHVYVDVNVVDGERPAR